MEERRKFERKLLTCFSRVVDQDRDWLLGYLVDLTPEGAMVAGEIPLDVQTRIRLRVDLPDAYTDQRQIELQAKVVWCVPDQDPGVFRTGLQLVDIDPLTRQVILKLTEEYGLSKG